MRLGLLVTVLASFVALAAAQRLPVQIEVRPLFGTTVPSNLLLAPQNRRSKRWSVN